MKMFVQRSSSYRLQTSKHRGWRGFTPILKLINIGAAIFFLIFTVAPGWTSAGDDRDVGPPSMDASSAMGSPALNPVSTPSPTSFMPSASSVLPMGDVIGRTLNTIPSMDGIESPIGGTGRKQFSDDGGTRADGVDQKDGVDVGVVFSGRWNVASRSIMNLEGDIGKEDTLEVIAKGQKAEEKGEEKSFSNEEDSKSFKENPVQTKAENQESEGSGTKTFDQGVPEFDGNFPGGEIAKKFLTDVRVIEGEVYVVDRVNAMSLLDPGESLRVFFKERPASTRAGGPVFEAGVLTQGVKSLAVVKTNSPPVMVVKADPVMPVAKDDAVAASVRDDTSAMNVDLPVGGAKDDTSALVVKADSSGTTIPLAPKEFVALALPSVTELAKSGTKYGILSNPIKNVFVKCRTGEWQAARDGMVILPGDEVRTASASSVKVLLEGDKVGQVEIMEGSLFRIQKSEIDLKTGGRTTLLDLAIGKVVVHAGKLEGKSKFEVRTPTALTGVRGTVFEVTVKEKP